MSYKVPLVDWLRTSDLSRSCWEERSRKTTQKNTKLDLKAEGLGARGAGREGRRCGMNSTMVGGEGENCEAEKTSIWRDRVMMKPEG